MPTGPGDDILDDVEAGTADKDILTKYKINNDQLKAFKSLHYGLSNQEMSYGEIGDYYPELNNYFKGEAPGSKAPPQGEPPQGEPVPKHKLLSLAREKVLLNKDIEAAGEPGILKDKEKMVQDIDKELQAQGYDPKDITTAFGDLPDLKAFDESAALQMRKDNPLQFDRYKSAIKSQYGLLNAVQKKEGVKAANSYLNNFINQQHAEDYLSQRQATREGVSGIYKYVDTNDDQRKILGDLIKDKSYGYGIGLPGQEEAITNDPRSKNMNPYQVQAMQFLEDTDPATAQAFDRLLNFSPEEVEKLQSNGSFARGFENKGRELENIGMNLQKRSIEEKMTHMLPNKDKWSEQEKGTFANLYERYNTLSSDMENQPKRYPMSAAMDADRLMQDAMGKSKEGIVSKTLLGIGENADDAINWVGDLIQSPFLNNKESALDDLQKLGDKKLSQLSQYETEGQELFNRNYKTVFTPQLQSEIDKIKNNESLTETEKQDQVRSTILKNNFKDVNFIPNDKGGKMNFTAQTVLNSISNTVSEIVPQIALAYISGGGANASKVKELTSLFGSTFATAYNDYYTQAIEENKPHPSQYAIVNTSIEAASELINNNVELAKKMFGGTKMGKLIEDVSQEGMNTLKRSGRFAALKEALKNTGKTGLKDAASEALEEMVGQLGSNAANKALFHEDVDLTDEVLKSGVSAFVGMLPLAGLGLPAKYKEVSTMQKYALYQAAMSPDKFLAKIDEDLKNGSITKSDAETRKTTIQKATEILNNISAVRSDGTLMNDNQKAKYLFNQFVKEDIQEKKKNLPDNAKEHFNKVEATIDNSINNLLKPRINDSETETKTETQADAEGLSVKPGVTPGATPEPEITSQPTAEENKQVGVESAPVSDLHYTNPAGTKYVLRGEDLYHVGKDGKETKFLEKAMKTPETQELIGKIKEANNQPDLYKQLEKLPSDQWQALRNGLPGDKNVNTTTEMVNAYNSGDPDIVNAVNKTLNLQSEQNVNQEQNPTKSNVTPAPGETPAIAQVNEDKGAVNEAAAEDDTTINTEDDVLRELNKIMQSKAPGIEQASAATKAQVKGKTKKARKPNEPLAKLADQNARVLPEDLGIDQADTAESVLDKLISQDDEFTPLLKILRKMPILKKIKFEVYSPGKNKLIDQYFQDKGLDPKQFAGLYFPKSKFTGTPYEALSNTLMLGNSSNVYYDLTHEFGHVLTIDNVGLWKKIMNASDRKLIEHIYKYIKDKKPDAKIEKNDQYGLATIEEFLVESIMNPAFRKYVSDVTVQNKVDFLSTAQKGEARDFILIIKEFFENLIKQILRKEQYAHGIENQPLIDKAVELATKLFLQGDEEVIKATEGGKNVSLDQYANVLPGGVLAMPAKKNTKLDKEEAIRKLIEKTPASIASEKLATHIANATGISEQEALDLVNDVRKPKIPPKPVIPTSILTKEERQVSINKINNLLNQPKPKEQTWLSKQLEGFKNASAWLDNPYRFITKITEDINKHYGLENKETIPLGRQFEKTASGKALLKVDSFINDVIRGNINGEKLGRLKGEKYQDFQRYLVSKRIIDRLNKQEEKTQAGEQVNRQTGNATRQDAEVMLDELKQKYGNLDDFTKRGEALQQHMDTVLQTLVASGILNKAAYDQIKADNDFYAPFSVIQAKMFAGQDKQPVGISGVIKRIKGIDYKLMESQDRKNPLTLNDSLSVIDALGDALREKIISPEEYFNTSFQILNDAKSKGLINDEEFNQHIAALENPGFALNDILDAAANMIYKAEGMALKNNMLQRLYAYKQADKEGLFIQDVDGFQTMTLPNGTTRKVPKPLNSIKVEPGMAPVKLRVGGKDVIVAVNKKAAEKLTQMSNFETSTFLKLADFANKLFRTVVITLSPGFQAVNFMIDFVRTSMLSRYGPLAGKGMVKPLLNAALFMPQYIDALLHSALGNTVYKTDTYKQWMKSDSFSKGMFDNLFDNEKRIKEVSAPLSKRILMNFIKFHWIDVPGSILEQTHKILTHQRGMSVEGFKPEMLTAMLGSIINRNINLKMSATELKDGMDRLNYEVQNFAGSPNFPQTHRYMKLASIFLQFFSARVKGEMTDYRRVSNLFSTIIPGIKSGKGEGVKLSKQDAMQIGVQFLGAAGAIAAFAIKNNMDDDDEKEFDGNSPFYQDNYLNIPLGYFEYIDDNDETKTLRDYAKVPLRGLTATMNVMANKYVKYYKRQNPEEFKKMAEAFIGNASPINLHGKDERELGESLASNLTPVFKYFIEYSFNRDTHNHRNIIPDYVQGKGMLSKYRKGDLKPWEVAIPKTPEWAKEFSKFMYDNLGISISAIEIDHMENTMGNPSELYDKAIKKRLLRSESKYPLYQPRDEEKNTSSATVTPVTE